MSARWPWAELGLSGKAPLREVKRAYAARLKEIDRSDPEAFGALRGAFDAAKGRAARNDSKRPRMAELAAEKAGTRAVPREPERARAPQQDEITDEPVALAKPEPAPEPAPAPEPVAPTAPRAKRRNPPVPPKPWGVAGGALDTLLDEDPLAAEDAFWTNLRKATKIWPWDTEALERLLSLDLAQDISRRRDVERLLFRNLKENVTSPETGYQPSIALLLERQFGWAADGVGLRRRLGYEPKFELMMHGHALSLPKTERPKAGTVVDQTHRWGWYKAGVFVILWLVSLQGQRISSVEDGIIQVIALFIFVWFMRWIIRGLVIGAAWIGRITRLSRPSRALFARFFPETEKALDRNPRARDFAQFVLAAILTALIFIAG
ncbi:MAG: hypothetical protein AAFY38_14095 [Pseudomonadota bacterium]